MPTTFEIIPITDHGHAFRIRRPHGKAHATDAINGDQMGSQHIAKMQMMTSLEQTKIKFR
jgi:hypothetical protein